MVLSFGDKPGRSGPGGPLCGDREIVDGVVEAAEGGCAPAEGELDRTQVDDAVTGSVLAAKLFEPVEQHGELVQPAELGTDEGALQVALQDVEGGQ